MTQPHPWLESIPWECVVEQNQKLCEAARVGHALLPERQEQVRKLWETVSAQTLGLPEALDALRACTAQAPFRYNNLNTFAAIARALVDRAARHLPAVEAHILKTTVAQYVERKIRKAELLQVLAEFDRMLPGGLTDVAVPPVAPVRVQPLAT